MTLLQELIFRRACAVVCEALCFGRVAFRV